MNLHFLLIFISTDQFYVRNLSSASDQSDKLIQIENRLVKKFDYVYLMPFLCALNLIQSFDKTALNFSAVLGIKQDASLSDTEFAWLGSIFYIGYLCFQGPSAYLIQKLPIHQYLGILIVIWGIVLGFTAMGKNFAQLLAFRFFLGVFEAGVFPCTVMLISRFYRRQEQAARIGFIYVFAGIAMSTGGILTFGIGHMNGVMGLKSWQWVMIILGCITVVFGATCFFFMISDPVCIATTPNEFIVIESRSNDNYVFVTQKIKLEHILEALTEWRYYCYMFFSFLVSLQSGALGVFSSIITKGFGFSDLNAILLSMPSGFVNSCCIFIALLSQQRLKNSALHYSACASLFISALGLVLLLVIPLPQAKLAGLYLCYASVVAVIMITASVTNNVSGYTKKIFYNISIVIFATLGSFTGPHLMREDQKPLYIGGLVTYIVADLLSIVLLLVARRDMFKKNKTRLLHQLQKDDDEQLDMTDKQDESFIYRL
ncbi:major facilitator superfamily domain-containing protein [Gilbertella persicaria]|uniref:major facilitator superfamily domain-containing protein n=1 Tax=Gilbertella persicaria TaxID=101096 RepID=UPI0022210514|nr:major facilitator superfamily domain-containing protein [Gilbertella persicaria]KAI8080707.1 major facilitator superfamily domain-containing protein [Gilbertella persicaria]